MSSSMFSTPPRTSGSYWRDVSPTIRFETSSPISPLILPPSLCSMPVMDKSGLDNSSFEMFIAPLCFEVLDANKDSSVLCTGDSQSSAADRSFIVFQTSPRVSQLVLPPVRQGHSSVRFMDDSDMDMSLETAIAPLCLGSKVSFENNENRSSSGCADLSLGPCSMDETDCFGSILNIVKLSSTPSKPKSDELNPFALPAQPFLLPEIILSFPSSPSYIPHDPEATPRPTRATPMPLWSLPSDEDLVTDDTSEVTQSIEVSLDGPDGPIAEEDHDAFLGPEVDEDGFIMPTAPHAAYRQGRSFQVYIDPECRESVAVALARRTAQLTKENMPLQPKKLVKKKKSKASKAKKASKKAAALAASLEPSTMDVIAAQQAPYKTEFPSLTSAVNDCASGGWGWGGR
ncbi:hypothetical protein JAAARDRAFT_198424 [Jaapia argillacea MUCL 33604]|uniref:Uncharacterized protein n=1 Tax=Jaapia argillacea MUCL 33604 TaxID=933084 RepID=A0A067PEH7_9AGAM|nr:hypothetical protein JAAARDRAFT_198424 [Jaapia argillacea MUCL 33604]